MLDSSLSTTRNDMRTLIKNAQALFQEASSVTGQKAEELRTKGLAMLDSAVAKAQQAQTAALESGKELASSADNLVKDNPWKAVAISGGVGLLLGMLIARK
jgi:ElaB/YqjD/DUF883 family membrane-anchored ribosome-binding protein